MHAIFFGMKRGFQTSLRVMRRPLERFGLTAARFDMLWCIHQMDIGWDEYPVLQSDLRKTLGVTAATVTRMIKSLEALGLVRRERDGLDRRQIMVSLTKEGLDRVRAAYCEFVHRKGAERVIVSALLGGPPNDDRGRQERSFAERRFDERSFAERRFDGRWFEPRSSDERAIGERRPDEQTASCAMHRLGKLLDRIREGFRDRADLHYRLHEDDHPRMWLMPGHSAGISGSP